jgi:hypothetical protein
MCFSGNNEGGQINPRQKGGWQRRPEGRLRVEESLLNREAAYREYAQAVRWRLVPGVW